VDNVCHAALLALERGEGGQAYFISDGRDGTLREVISALLRSRGIDAPKASVPLPVAWWLAQCMEWVWRVFKRPGEPPITRQMLRLIGQPFTLNIDKAERELGYRPILSWEQGLDAMQST
jgi:nucleoside-diphosphate-sugar epimerase